MPKGLAHHLPIAKPRRQEHAPAKEKGRTPMKADLRISTATLVLATCLSACTSPSPTSPASIQNSCINPTEITGQTIVSDQEIQFELRNGETWVNKFPRACPGLKLAGGFSWEVRGTLVCSNQERIIVQETGTPCLIGEFSRVAAK